MVRELSCRPAVCTTSSAAVCSGHWLLFDSTMNACSGGPGGGHRRLPQCSWHCSGCAAPATLAGKASEVCWYYLYLKTHTSTRRRVPSIQELHAGGATTRCLPRATTTYRRPNSKPQHSCCYVTTAVTAPGQGLSSTPRHHTLNVKDTSPLLPL